MNKIARSKRREDVLSFARGHAWQPRGGSNVHTLIPVLLERLEAENEAVWWNSRSRFKHLRGAHGHPQSEIQPKGTIVLRTVDRDPLLTVGAERTLIRKDGLAVFPLGDCRRETHSCTPWAKLCDRLDGQRVRHACMQGKKLRSPPQSRSDSVIRLRGTFPDRRVCLIGFMIQGEGCDGSGHHALPAHRSLHVHGNGRRPRGIPTISRSFRP